MLNILAVLAYLFCLYVGIGFVYNGYKITRDRKHTYRRRRYIFRPVERVTETGRYTVIIGIGEAISGCLLFVASVLQLIQSKSNFLGFMFGAFLIVAIIQLGADIFSVFFRETPIEEVQSGNE